MKKLQLRKETIRKFTELKTVKGAGPVGSGARSCWECVPYPDGTSGPGTGSFIFCWP